MSSKFASKGRNAAVPMPTKTYDPIVQLDDTIQIPKSDLRQN